MERNRFRKPGTGSGDYAIAALVRVQKAAPKSSDVWWTRGYLYERAGLPRAAFEDALARIRARKVPGWHYKRAGRRAAYCMEEFANLLPEDLRPTAGEMTTGLPEKVRRHVLETIDVAMREYHAIAAQPPTEMGLLRGLDDPRLKATVKPYYEHVLGLAKSGRLEGVKDLVPRMRRGKSVDISEYERVQHPRAEEMARWLLDVKERLVSQG